MIPLHDDQRRREFPWVTLSIILLLGIIYLWDRKWSLFENRVVFADLGARPADIVAALRGGDPDALKTLFSSSFLHANLNHIIFNVLFLWVFGPRVEMCFGPLRFMIYYLFWGVFATATQVFVMPNSGIAVLGASGAIAGVMGSFLLLFPAARINAIVPPFVFNPIYVPAWFLLGIWFLFQVFVAQPGVANWAHVGGFLGGILIVLMLGEQKREACRVAGAPNYQ